MKKMIVILLFFPLFLGAQTEEKETVYVLFDVKSNEKCTVEIEQTYDNKSGIEFVKKFRKKVKSNKKITFYICDEIFGLRKKQQIDTCSTQLLKKVAFKDLRYLNAQRDALKPVNFFKNSVFKKIYFIEPHDDYVIKYEVIWITDLIQN